MNTNLQDRFENFFLKRKPFIYRKRETILFSNDIPPGIFYVKRGYVRNYITSKNGKEFTSLILRPGDIFPIRSALSSTPTSHNYQSLTNTEVIKAPKEDFINFLLSDKNILLFTMNKIMAKQNQILRRLETVILGNAREKILGLFLSLDERLTINNPFVVPLEFTHQELAAMTGITRETVSVEIEKLESEGIIKQQHKRFTVLNTDQIK